MSGQATPSALGHYVAAETASPPVYSNNKPVVKSTHRGGWGFWKTAAVIGIGIGAVALAITGVGMVADAAILSAALAGEGLAADATMTAVVSTEAGVIDTSEADVALLSEQGTAVEKDSSQILRKNLIKSGERVPEYPNAAHHIVAGSSPKAQIARQILRKFNIGINDANNGVFLPIKKSLSDAVYHPSLHTNVYYNEVNNLLQQAITRDEAIQILKDIAQQLKEGMFPK